MNPDHVLVTRHRRTYRRSVNGPWLGGPNTAGQPVRIELAALRHWTVGDGWLVVTFPDGKTETMFANTATHTGKERKFSYGPRLQALLAD